MNIKEQINRTLNIEYTIIHPFKGSFEEALYNIKQGEYWTRRGWHGRTKWVRFWLLETYTVTDTPSNVLSHLVLQYEDGTTVPWFPNRCDILENDWYEYKPDWQ